MLRHLDQLSDDYEYGLIWWGQSRARPYGSAVDAMVAEPDMLLGSFGVDLDVLSISGNVIQVATALAANAWVGAQFRFIYQQFQNDAFCVRAGIATVGSNTTSSLTVTWAISPPALQASAAVTLTSGTPGTVNLAAHTLQQWDRVRFSTTGTLPPELAAGTTYYVSAVGAGTFQVATTLGGASIAFTTTGSGSISILPIFGGYLHNYDRWQSYPSVRTLVPYQPELTGPNPGWPPSIPGKTIPSSITSFDDLALWLELNFREGVEGLGFATTGTVSGNVLTPDTVPTWATPTNMLIGATVLLTDAAGARYSGTVTTNNATTQTVSAWTGGAPSGAVACEIHLPHWRNNPNHALHGFRYPGNDMQPCGFRTTGITYVRPNYFLTTLPEASYTPVVAGVVTAPFGAAVATAWRLSQRIGRRVNLIQLAFDGTSLIQQGHELDIGFHGQIGWNQHRDCPDWSLSRSNGLAARLARLITVVAPGATSIESGKPLRILGIVGMQGESDAVTASGQANYRQNLQAMLAFLRRKIDAAGMNPYRGDAKVPVLHAQLGSAYGLYDPDRNVAAAITDVVARDGFASTVETTDFPTVDTVHLNGVGEVQFAARAEPILGDLIDDALSWGLGDAEIELANAALSIIGEPANVTALDPPNGTRQAELAAQFFKATRNEILQWNSMAWTFATRRVTPQLVDSEVSTWDYAYAAPADLVSVVSVLDPESSDEDQIGLRLTDPYVGALNNPMVNPLAPATQPYRLEYDRGCRVLRTNQESAVLRYVSSTISVAVWDPLVQQAFVWRLAHKLVGQFSKGKTGAALAGQYLQASEQLLAQAAAANAAGTQDVPHEQKASWLP